MNHFAVINKTFLICWIKWRHVSFSIIQLITQRSHLLLTFHFSSSLIMKIEIWMMSQNDVLQVIYHNYHHLGYTKITSFHEEKRRLMTLTTCEGLRTFRTCVGRSRVWECISTVDFSWFGWQRWIKWWLAIFWWHEKVLSARQAERKQFSCVNSETIRQTFGTNSANFNRGTRTIFNCWWLTSTCFHRTTTSCPTSTHRTTRITTRKNFTRHFG